MLYLFTIVVWWCLVTSSQKCTWDAVLDDRKEGIKPLVLPVSNTMVLDGDELRWLPKCRQLLREQQHFLMTENRNVIKDVQNLEAVLT